MSSFFGIFALILETALVILRVMVEIWLKGRFATRAAIVSVTCLCLLQGLVFASLQFGRSMHPADAGSSAVASPSGELCRVDTRGGGNAPARHDHSQCCILCSSSAQDAMFRFAAVLFAAVVFPTLRTSDAIGWRFVDETATRPAGWTSSWSSRAPPSLS